MHFVVLGCGRVGAALALQISEMGHTVAVIDQDPRAFRRLGPDFSGDCVTGLGFDRDTLEAARTAEAYAFAAVSSGDNSNIIAARVARETYGVRQVVARIYDPDRAELYERLGIATVGTVRWASGQVLRRMIPDAPNRELQDVSGRLTLAEFTPETTWIGTPLTEIEARTGARIAYLTRLGQGVLPRPGDVLQEADRLHLMVATARMEQTEVDLAHLKQELDEAALRDRADAADAREERP